MSALDGRSRCLSFSGRFGGVQIGRGGRQATLLLLFDLFPHWVDLVQTQVVHHHHIAGLRGLEASVISYQIVMTLMTKPSRAGMP